MRLTHGRSSVLQESWQTPLDESIQSSGEFCSPHCFPSSNPRFPRTPPRTPPRSPLRTPPRTPLSDLTREIPPSAPLRILRERPDLSMGVAIAAHRLDCEYDLPFAFCSTFDDIRRLLPFRSRDFKRIRGYGRDGYGRNGRIRQVSPLFHLSRSRKSRESEFSYPFYPQFAQTGEFLAQAAAQFRGPPRFPTSTPLRPPPPPPPPPLALERTYRLHRGRSPQFPTVPRAQIPPRMTRMTPCGKCLRVIVWIAIFTRV